MIKYNRFILDNGLRVLVHEDNSTPMAVVNVLYNVGSRDEDPEKTGFAHLFEHLMFGGSINIPEYDEPLNVLVEKIMHIQQMILQIIIASCLQKILKLLSGWKATAC